jgi:hypothetical protein
MIVRATVGDSPTRISRAPSSRTADDIRTMWCAASMSNTGTPETSRITTCARASETPASSFSVSSWARTLSNIPTSGTTRTPSWTGAIGVDAWRIRSSSRVCSAYAAVSSDSWLSSWRTSSFAACS